MFVATVEHCSCLDPWGGVGFMFVTTVKHCSCVFMRNTVDPDIFVAVNVCKFEFNINFAAESLQF